MAASLLVLTATAPALAVIALLIAATSRGGPFFRQQRTGLYGRPFFILKFRTMVKDAPRLGPGVTGAGDPRVTPIGRFLRATKLDELPNFVNVLRGEMSVVGPRPDLPRFMITLSPEQRRILDCRPGITGITQLRYIAEEEMLSPINVDDDYVENVLKDKIRTDLAYVEGYSFGGDMIIIARTVAALITKVCRLAHRGGRRPPVRC